MNSKKIIGVSSNKGSMRNKQVIDKVSNKKTHGRDTDDVKQNVGQDYTLDEMVGRGSFGYVYKGIHRKTGNEIACKAEKISGSNKERLRAEYSLYKTFRNRRLSCVPRVDAYLSTKEWNLMMMQLLGCSLDKIFADNGSRLDLGTVMKIGLQILDGLQEIHDVGVIHRDIKPNNFMFGRREENEDTKLYIVDFGLSKLWKDNRTGMHISQKQGRSMIGTARYASINIHLGIEPSRRDDLESLGYVMVYLAKGKLPWQGLAKKRSGSPRDEIKDKKMSTSTESLCSGLPSCFKEMIDYAKSLSFQQKPDYELINNMIRDSSKKDDIELVLAWEEEDYYDNQDNQDNHAE
jgi:serine/threonine protein kinase